MTKTFKVLSLVILIMLAVFLFLIARNFYLIRTGGLVKWDNQWYTKKELAEKFPPQYYEVEAKNTPEEAYAGFRQALLDNNHEKALEYVVEEKREEYSNAFQEKEDLDNWIKQLPENITKEDEYGNFASFYYLSLDTKDEVGHKIEFVKNKKGFWMISGI